MECEWVIPALRSLHVLLLRRAAEAWSMEGGKAEQGGASVVLCRMAEEWDDVLFKVPTCVSPCMLRVCCFLVCHVAYVGLLFSARPPPCSCPLARACVDARTLAQALTEALRLHSALVLLLSPTASSRQASGTGEADTLQLLGGQAREDEGDEEAGRRRRGRQQPQKGRALVAPRNEDEVSAARSPAMSAEELKAWFVNDLSPARQLDALCSMWGGTSDILLDLMLSPDNQALAYLVAALASLHTRPSFESASPSSGSYRHEDGPIGGNELKVGHDPPATASDSSGASAVSWRCRLQGGGEGGVARAYEEVAAGAAGEDGFDAAPSVVALQVLLRASLLQSSSPARLRVPFAHVEMHP